MSSQKLEGALNDLHTMVTALGLNIGQKLMPVVTKGLEWLGHDGKVLIVELMKAIDSLIDTLIALAKTAVEATGDVLHAFEGMRDKVKPLIDDLSNIWADLNFKAHADHSLASMGTGADDAAQSVAKLAEAWDKLKVSLTAALDKTAPQGHLGGGGRNIEHPGEANPYAQGGGDRSFVEPKKGKGNKTGEKMRNEEIQAAQKLSEERIAIEESTNQHLLSMGQESVEDFISRAHALENEKYQVKNAALQKELTLHAADKAAEQKTRDEIEQLYLTHQGALIKIDQDRESRLAAQAKAALADFIRIDDEKLAEGMESIKRLVAAEQIGTDQEFAMQTELTQKIRVEELRRLDDEISALKAGTTAYGKATDERAKLAEKFTKDQEKNEDAHTAKIQADTTKWLQPMTSSFTTALNDMAFHQRSFADSMRGMFLSMAEGFAQMCEKMLEDWIVKEVAGTAVHEGNAVAQITASAGVAGAAGASSQAGIPIIGPALAAAAGAAMIALVLGYESLAHASGGMVLDRDQLVFAHANEMILPAHLSQGVQSMISNGTTNNGGSTTLNYTPTVHGSPDVSLHQLLRDQGGAMLAYLAQARRDGKI
jgi:hypothetical protein